MNLFMIHKAYMPVYKSSRFFLRDGTDGTDQPKVVQEVLADLKSLNNPCMIGESM